MKIFGIICEYDPLHFGHIRHINHTRKLAGTDGIIICVMSGNFLQRGLPSTMNKFTRAKHAILSGGKETLKLKTESGYYGTEEDIAYAILSDYKTGLERDLRLGFTNIGPHRDDIKFTLNDTDVKVYGSQGQQRTVALSLKLAETEIFKSRFGEYPILILDDVLSELDKTRQKKLVESVKDMQTIFTATDYSKALFKGIEVNRIVIENGKIKQSKKK